MRVFLYIEKRFLADPVLKDIQETPSLFFFTTTGFQLQERPECAFARLRSPHLNGLGYIHKFA